MLPYISVHLDKKPQIIQFQPLLPGGTIFELSISKNHKMNLNYLSILGTLATLIPVIMIIKTAISMAKDKRLN
jgi:hypothetical protein